MAQSEGPPRKTTTYNTFEGMNTQSERYGIEKEWFAWLENIMWVGPHKLHSVPGPRAVGSIPPPPPPPETPSCPPEPTLIHIDEGFTQILLGSWSLDQTNLVVYYYGSVGGQDFTTKFDMVATMVSWATNGNGKRWTFPGVDPTNGDLYVGDVTGGIQGVAQVSTVDGSQVRASGHLTAPFNTLPIVTSDTIFTALSSPGSNILCAIDKATLALRWRTTTPGSSLGVGNRISGMCKDSNEDVWIHTHQSGSGANSTVLIKFDKTTGAGTVHDISSTFPAGGTFANIGFDPINNNIIIAQNGGTAKFALSGFTATLINATNLLENGNAVNGIVDGKIWRNTATQLLEYSAVDGSLLQTILKTTIVGGVTVTNWSQVLMMSSINCLHLNHGTFPAHPIGGVDRVCLPC